MKSLAVDFAPPRPLPVWLWVTAVLVLLAVAGHQARLAWTARHALQATQQESTTLSAKVDQAAQARDAALARARIDKPYAQDAAAIARLASFPLARVLTSLETARVQGIKLTAVDIAPGEGSVKVELQYTDNDSLMHYLEELNAGEPRPRWRLIQAQTGSSPEAGSTARIGSMWAAADR